MPWTGIHGQAPSTHPKDRYTWGKYHTSTAFVASVRTRAPSGRLRGVEPGFRFPSVGFARMSVGTYKKTQEHAKQTSFEEPEPNSTTWGRRSPVDSMHRCRTLTDED